jgi:iron complex transport system substrate-binding protein
MPAAGADRKNGGIMKKLLLILGCLLLIGGLVFAGGEKEVAAGSTQSASEWAESTTGNLKTNYPVTITNGNREITFDASPTRMLTNGDSNIIELAFVLGLEDRMLGYAGFPYYGYEVSDAYKPTLEKLTEVSNGYIKLETLLDANPDFFLSGYWYGLDIPGDCTENCITPEELERYDIKSYAISESLVRVMEKPPVSMEDTYTDIRNLGIIFDEQERARDLISEYKNRVESVESKVSSIDEPLKVFLYTGGQETPGTAAGQAMPNALLKLAGAENIFNDIADSWVSVSWEEVVGRNPDFILILEYGKFPGEIHKQYLLDNPALAGVNALKNNKIHVMRVEDTYTGPRAVIGLEEMAKLFYPELF